MPIADSAETGRRWATERANDLYAIFAGDLDPRDIDVLTLQALAAKRDGAKFAVIVPNDGKPSPGEQVLADLFVEHAPAPSPFGLFLALEAAKVEDSRRLVVIGGSLDALRAGHRAG